MYLLPEVLYTKTIINYDFHGKHNSLCFFELEDAMKKVITGHNADGKAIFVKEEPEEVTIGSPILDWHEIWAELQQDRAVERGIIRE